MLRLSFLIFISSFLIGLNNGNVYAQQKAHDLNFSFAAAGDWGCDEKAQSTVRNIQNKSPNLVLALGDLSYQKNADCWFNMMSPLLNKTKIAIGDHEYHFKNSMKLKEYTDKFHLLNQYYSFDRLAPCYLTLQYLNKWVYIKQQY